MKSKLNPQPRRIGAKKTSTFSDGKTLILNFSSKEKIFIERLAQGDSYRQIAGHMGVSPNTVREHVRSVYKKLGVHSRTKAVVKYQQLKAVKRAVSDQKSGHSTSVSASLIHLTAAQLRKAADLKKIIETAANQLDQLSPSGFRTP